MILPDYAPTLSLSLFHPTPSPQSLPRLPRERILTSMGPDMPLQIKGVVESFPTEGAQVSLHLAVALDVTVEHPLQAKAFATQLAVMQGSVIAGASGELRSGEDCVSIGMNNRGPTEEIKQSKAGLIVALKKKVWGEIY